MTEWFTQMLANRDAPATPMAFTQAFLAASPPERDAIRSAWDATLQWALPNPWRLACVSDGPGSCEERILTDLLFQALSGVGSRESIMGLAVIFNSCKLAGLEPVAIFARIASAVPGAPGEALIHFAKRAPEDQSMEAFMLTAISDPKGGYEIKANW